MRRYNCPHHSLKVILIDVGRETGPMLRRPALQIDHHHVHVQKAVCTGLKLKHYADIGQWPDILSQALEVKLQTSATIDLGLVSPDSNDPAQKVGINIRHRDIRYPYFMEPSRRAVRCHLTVWWSQLAKAFSRSLISSAGKL
jgi:hypothetical protein